MANVAMNVDQDSALVQGRGQRAREAFVVAVSCWTKSTEGCDAVFRCDKLFLFFK